MSEVAVWGVIVGRRSHRQKKRKENLTLGSPFCWTGLPEVLCANNTGRGITHLGANLPLRLIA